MAVDPCFYNVNEPEPERNTGIDRADVWSRDHDGDTIRRAPYGGDDKAAPSGDGQKKATSADKAKTDAVMRRDAKAFEAVAAEAAAEKVTSSRCDDALAAKSSADKDVVVNGTASLSPSFKTTRLGDRSRATSVYSLWKMIRGDSFDGDIDDGEDEERRIAVEVVKTFCRQTTAHGRGSVTQSGRPSLVVRLVWLFVSLASLFCVVGHIVLLAVQYFRYASEFRLRTVVREVNFPSVTVCNLAPMSPTTRRRLLADRTSLISD